jgi:DNA transformation protein
MVTRLTKERKMGQKGAKLTQEATEASEKLVQKLAGLGNVSYRKMFGGYGIFESEAMFALITSKGIIHFKVDPSNRKRFEDAGADQHSKMPYFEVPPSVLKDEQKLLEWAKDSINIARASKAKK